MDDKSGYSTDPDVFDIAERGDPSPSHSVRNKANINFSTQRSDASLYSNRGPSVKSNQFTSQFAPDYRASTDTLKQGSEQMLKM